MNHYYSLPMFYGVSHRLFKLAKQMRLEPTEAESKLWETLTSESFKKYKFRRQHPIANYIADFYCHEFKLVIEADGKIHSRGEQKQYDVFRDEDMKQFEIKVLRFTNEEIIGNMESVIEKIHDVIK